jgi:hypothetical protein
MRSCCVVAALVCGAVALSGCQSDKDQAKEYPLSVAEAVHRLDHADNEGFRYHRHCGVLFKVGSNKSDDHSVTWTARASNKKDVLSFTVSVLPSRNGVTTQISVPLEKNGREMYDGTQNYNHPVLRQPIRPAIAELVDAAMEKRSFDNARIPEKDRYRDPSPSASACSVDSQILDQGFAAEYDDPPGPSIETVRKLAEKNNWPKN